MECPFCGGELVVHNEYWIDPMVECSCTPHLMRMSEVEAHTGDAEPEMA